MLILSHMVEQQGIGTSAVVKDYLAVTTRQYQLAGLGAPEGVALAGSRKCRSHNSCLSLGAFPPVDAVRVCSSVKAARQIAGGKYDAATSVPVLQSPSGSTRFG